MTRDEFLIRLRTLVSDLPPEEREDVMHYYTEYFIEAGPENEQQVIRQLGSPENVAREVLGGGFRARAEGSNSYSNDSYSQPEPPGRRPGLWGAILALFAAPVAVPLLFAGVILAGAMGLVALCLLAVPFIIGVAFVASGVMNLVLAFGLGHLGFATVWVFFGTGLFMAAAGVLGLVFSAKLLIWGFRGIVHVISGLFYRRRRPQ